MKIGVVIAMKEEFKILSSIFSSRKIQQDVYDAYLYKYSDIDVVGIISGIGKAASASATTYLINRYQPDIIINFGSCGGVNKAKIGSLIMSNQASYGDVDVTAFGYLKGQLPNQPQIFRSNIQENLFQDMLTSMQKKYTVNTGLITTCDSFIADKNKVEEIKSIYEDIIAIEMEAASLAQICNLYNTSFLLLKKVSDLADKNASENFQDEINNIDDISSSVLEDIFKYFVK